MFSIFSSEISKICVELPHDLIYRPVFFLVRPLKKLAAKFQNLSGKIQNLATDFFKDLTQKSGPINKVMLQFYAYPENFRWKY